MNIIEDVNTMFGNVVFGPWSLMLGPWKGSPWCPEAECIRSTEVRGRHGLLGLQLQSFAFSNGRTLKRVAQNTE